MTPNLEDAIELALRAHRGQMDKAGQPYILHPLRVMLSLATEVERMVGVLHDVVEDTREKPCAEDRITFEKLREWGYPEAVVEAIERLTKLPEEEGEAGYARFVERVKGNALARRVKLADLADNLDVSRLEPPLDERDLARVNRYLDALRTLNDGDSITHGASLGGAIL
jgi:(p)ppGpp synthase/HD superfamily hydrolase